MEEKPREAIRRKKDSSMRVAIDLVHEGRASAAVSAGNTGALTAIAHFVLKTLPGVERAAIISAIPAAHGLTQMLDLGANTKATPEQLRQFAAMGVDHRARRLRARQPAHRTAQHRRGRHEGARGGAGGARAARRGGAQLRRLRRGR